MLPKIKIHDLSTQVYTKDCKVQLLNNIKLKNTVLADMMQNTEIKFEVVVNSEKEKCAVMKVSPKIRNYNMKQKSLEKKGMESHHVTDQYHII